MKLNFKGITITISKNYFESNSRIKSWEICHKQFELYLKCKINDDLMALNLFAYLSNWGMLRNSELINYNYTIFEDLLKELKNEKKYKKLLNRSPGKTNSTLITELYEHIEKYLNDVNIKATDTLVTKIILGTYACLPAFDTNVKNAIKKVHKGKHRNKGKINIIKDIFIAYGTDIKKAKNRINNTNKKSKTQISKYTDMRTLDAILWELGK